MWLEVLDVLDVLDVGNDNDTYFPLIGAEFAALGLSRSRVIGSALCQLAPAVDFVDYARKRLSQLLPQASTGPDPEPAPNACADRWATEAAMTGRQRASRLSRSADRTTRRASGP
ncbi:hypothetical protein [Streptomyces sp. AB3(2024)]|uniref:hypothetical protein n=1 Tax=Streptomyces sp. AB3(2024) TaxID=3317321 RepID=UPI0035A3586E